MTWRPARSLDVLLAEVNKLAPKRSKTSDGTIGDTAHSARTSDHNPNSAGVVRARDITHDPADGCDCNVLASKVAALLGKHPALGAGAYVIWNRRIISTNRKAEGWRTYTGSNPHSKHMHVSVGTRGYDDTTPWLKTPAPAKAKPKAIAVRIRECSMQYSDTPAQKAIDAKAAFNPTPGGLRPHVVLFTEAGRGQNKVGQDLLRKEGERLGYAMFFDGYEGGIAIKFASGRVVDHGYEGPIIPGKAGDHPHLGLTWATVKHRSLGDMTFGVFHWLNRDVEAARARVNNAATKKVGAFLAAKAAGDALGFLAGDANRDDKTRDLLPGIPFRTAADELGVYPDTHGTRTIDFIASHDKDLRVRCTSFRTLPRAHSDHRWIEATYAITPRSAA